jgi:hypothetical protein
MIDTGQHIITVEHRLVDGPDHERYAQKVRSLYGNPSNIDPFVFRAEISSDRLDAYFTRMHDSTLRNYAEDAARGVALLNSHRHTELPLGYSLDGEYVEGDTPAVRAAFYTVPGLQLGPVATDHLIRGIEAGIIRDMSVGFHGGEYACSVCQRSLFDGECRHIPGLSYEKREGDSVIGSETAFAWIKGAHLSEVSVVYDGATPGAAILKAEQEAGAGRLAPETARVLEARYRIKLPGTRHVYPGITLESKEQPMDELSEVRSLLGLNPDADLLDGVRALLAQRATDADNMRAAHEALTSELAQARAQIEKLTAEAALGRAYRVDLVERALAEGVRAYGNDFDTALYKGVLEAASIEVIKHMTNDWSNTAGRLFGERQTTEKGEPAPAAPAAPANHIDNRAYRA